MPRHFLVLGFCCIAVVGCRAFPGQPQPASPPGAGPASPALLRALDAGVEILLTRNLSISFREPFKYATVRAAYIAIRGEDRQEREGVVFEYDPASRAVRSSSLYLAGRFVADPALRDTLLEELRVLMAKEIPVSR